MSAKNEVSKSPELLAVEKRFVIFGSNMSGARNVHDQIHTVLDEKGLLNYVVEQYSDPCDIENAFFGRLNKARTTPTFETQLSVRERLGRVGAKIIDLAKRNKNPYKLQEGDTLPLGVFITSDMRQHHNEYAMNMQTPARVIENLCREFNVTFINASAHIFSQNLPNYVSLIVDAAESAAIS